MKYNVHLHNRRSIRIPGYDYSQPGEYFITMCTQDRECLFGEIVKGKIRLNKYGVIAHEEWLKTPILRPNITLDEFIIMPNHVHGIIVINKCPEISTTTRGINIMESSPFVSKDHFVGAYCNTPLQNGGLFRSPSQTIGAIIRGYKSTVTKQINILRKTPKLPIWQRNYYEHIIQNDSYDIREYIKNNPASWKEDRLFSPLVSSFT